MLTGLLARPRHRPWLVAIFGGLLIIGLLLLVLVA